MSNDNFYDLMFEVMSYELSDAAPHGYFRTVILDELKTKEMAKSFLECLEDLIVQVGGDIGKITDAGDPKYNAGAYFLARVPLEIGDATYSLFPSLLGDGRGEIAPYMGVCFSGYGYPKGEFNPKAFNLPSESYFQFLGDFIAPSSMMEFSPKVIEFFLSHFLGLASRGLAHAILMKGLSEFRLNEGKLQGYVLELWEYFIEVLQNTIDEL